MAQCNLLRGSMLEESVVTRGKLVSVVAALVVQSMPDIARYLKIREM